MKLHYRPPSGDRVKDSGDTVTDIFFNKCPNKYNGYKNPEQGIE